MRIAIVGLGQIGASIGAALRARRTPHRLVGVDRDASIAREAFRRGVVHESGTDLSAVRSADLTVLAAPVRTILRQLGPIAGLAKPGAVVTDVGSTKEGICRAVPRGMRFVPGHPMAGSERAGLEGRNANLFAGRPWVLLDSPDRARVARLVRSMGARPVFLRSAAEHDRIVAECSHLPHVIACALLGLGADLRYAGGSFRDASRVALSDVEMVLDFLVTNRHLRRVTDRFVRRLQALTRGREPALRRALVAARRLRSRLP